jgi:hypothetical protein
MPMPGGSYLVVLPPGSSQPSTYNTPTPGGGWRVMQFGKPSTYASCRRRAAPPSRCPLARWRRAARDAAAMSRQAPLALGLAIGAAAALGVSPMSLAILSFAILRLAIAARK